MGRTCEGSEIITATLQNSEICLEYLLIREPVETLSSILQSPHLSLNEAKSAVANVTKILTAFRTGRSFAALWQDCLSRLADLDVKEPQTPRVIRPPKKTDAASDTVHSFSSDEEFYRQGYYEIIDALIKLR